MFNLANPHPLSSILYRKNSYYSPRLYVKESRFRRREREIILNALPAIGTVGGLLLTFAIFNFVG